MLPLDHKQNGRAVKALPYLLILEKKASMLGLTVSNSFVSFTSESLR